MFDQTEIQQLAGLQNFLKGMVIQKEDGVQNLNIQGSTITATVVGQQKYRVKIDCDSLGESDCTCPAAVYQPFCKHCVATALAALAKLDPQQPGLPVPQRDTERLRQYFQTKSYDEVIALLLEYIRRDDDEYEKWLFTLDTAEKGSSLSLLKKQVTQALPLHDVWGWNEVRDYFTKAELRFDAIWPEMETLSVEDQWELAAVMIERLNKCLEHIDDSGGFRFTIEGQLNERMSSLFSQLNWPATKKAEWLFEHFNNIRFDVFPAIPEDFTLDDETEKLFLSFCMQQLETVVSKGDLTKREVYWAARRNASPLIDAAKRRKNWKEEIHIQSLYAVSVRDYLDLSKICLENQEALEAEHWLRRAEKAARDQSDKRTCRQYEVDVRLALGEKAVAWKLAWELFTEQPNFGAYQSLRDMHKQLGEPEPEFLNKIEAIFLASYREPSQFGVMPVGSDSVLEFYLEQHELEKARDWIKEHKASSALLIRLANNIVGKQPDEAIALYARVVSVIIDGTNNSAYQRAIDLLITLRKNLEKHKQDKSNFYLVISDLAKKFKQKRNMVALLKKHFP